MFLNFIDIGVELRIENPDIRKFFEYKYVNQISHCKFETCIQIIELHDSKLYSITQSSLENITSNNFMGTDIAYNDKKIIFFSNDVRTGVIQQVSLYLSFIMQIVLSYHNIYLLHGACIVDNNQGIIIIGNSGAGKSSILLREITEYNKKMITDDILILTIINAQIIAVKNIHSIGINEEDLNRYYPYLKPFRDISQKDNYQIKSRINYEKYDNSVYVDKIGVKKIIFLCERQAKPTIKKIDASKAFKYLVNSHRHYFKGVIDFFDIFTHLVHTCDCYQLNICIDIEETINILNSVLNNEE